ncbi:hypothetical protein MCOR31_009183 [Pyricularia oryzae]|nr:hypothetical protein MCOR31_009183 [Pyricularia oryzae]
MKLRITFLHRPGDAVDPASLKITDDSLAGPDLHAAREVRATFARDELPAELLALLAATNDFHVRWVGPHAYQTVSPLQSRLPPGFHLFYTPLADEKHQDSAVLTCDLLRKAFGGLENCISNESFVSLPKSRFSHSPAHQFYQPLEDLRNLTRYIRDDLCPENDPLCRAQAERLTESVSLDISWDSTANILRVTTMSPYQAQPLTVTSYPGHRTEVGMLGEDTAPTLERHEVGISGHLVVLAERNTPSPTVFGFPSRHRAADGDSVTSFFPYHSDTSTGLHPTLRLVMTSRKPDEGSCTPHAYLTLPRTIFADMYQLSDPLFLASKNLTALRYMSSPVDLEAPDYAMSIWGSFVLVDLAQPSVDAGDAWTAEIPLHLRYLAPATGGHRSIEVPAPAVFWACAADEVGNLATNPFDRTRLGYDGLFDVNTVFWHLEPRPPPLPVGTTRLVLGVDVPVLDIERSGWIGAGTAAVILLGFGWVVWKLLGAGLAKSAEGGTAPGVQKPETKKTQ